jgi:hypothetical protein
MATSVAAPGVPLTIAYGLKGFVANASFILIGLVLHSGGIGRFHAFRGKEKHTRRMKEEGFSHQRYYMS